MTTTKATAEHLKSIIARIERIEAEKAELSADIREIYAEAKGNGFDPKTIRQIIKERRMSAADRAERQEMLETYRSALGMLADTPLGQSALLRSAA